jgi:glucose-1-phosphate cytidylyltransferase
MVCDRKLFRHIDDNPGMMLEREPMNALVRAKELTVYRHDGFWQPMDTYQEFMLLNGMWARGNAPWKVWP